MLELPFPFENIGQKENGKKAYRQAINSEGQLNALGTLFNNISWSGQEQGGP